MEDQYEMGDLRQCIHGRVLLPPISQPPPDLLSGHSGFTAAQHYETMLMLPRGLHHEFLSDSTTSASFKSASTGGASSIGAVVGGFDMDAVGFNGGGDIGGNGRWPRQETLTLLEIRSRLDHKFKEANQKGPLWDEVSRIMSEEHGYQRSGKKCREKFENLYKYYKKTKEGKAGRQDGKHYRFFRQLEALYGETNNGAINYKPSNETYAAPRISDNNCSLSLSNSSDFNTTSSDESEEQLHEGDNSTNKRKRIVGGKRSWKTKIRDFIDSQMSKLMAKQEAWMEKMMTRIEHKEQERMLREEEWRKQDAERIEREQNFWANERAWIEGRDAALMEALHKLNGKELTEVAEIQNNNNNNVVKNNDDVNNYMIEANYRRRENHTSRLNENGMNDLCFRYFTGDGDNTNWENYGQKINKGYK